jgi:hypothetical protein
MDSISLISAEDAVKTSDKIEKLSNITMSEGVGGMA